VSDALSFDLSLSYPGFSLAAAAEIPLSGITALSGPSGSGKTTLLRALAGLEQAQGTLSFADQDWTSLTPAARGIGYVFQDARLFPHLTVADNLAYGATRRNTSQTDVKAVIDALDLGPLLQRMPENLSGGETRRVALGRALASGPSILLLDEPLTGLDRARKAALMPYVARAVAHFGVPAIYVTHSMGEISFLADRILLINEGQLTGWMPAEPRLIGQVVNTAPGQIALALADMTFWLNGQGTVGELWAIPLGQDFLISSEPLGLSNATASFEARVTSATAGSGTIDVVVAGQILTLPWSREDGATPAPDTPLWISLPKLTARPIQIDVDQVEQA